MRFMIADKSYWHTAYTLRNFEKKVDDELRKRNGAAYLLLQIVFKQWSEMVKKLYVPLFNNYIYVKSTELDAKNVIQTKVILRLCSFKGKPEIIPDLDIAAIKKLSGENPEVGNATNKYEGFQLLTEMIVCR